MSPTQSTNKKHRTKNTKHTRPDRYALADDAWRSLRDLYSDQVIVITGESGSGKTEAFKLILQYIGIATGRSREFETVRQQLLLSNPVLEAFGNAKSIHNDNSSRFVRHDIINLNICFFFKRFSSFINRGNMSSWNLITEENLLEASSLIVSLINHF